jgi:phosphoserine phosphatase RsbU/P
VTRGEDRHAGLAAIIAELRAGRPLGAVVAVAIAGSIMLLDLLEGPRTQYVGLLVATPFMAASFVPPVPTVVAGLSALTLGATYGAYAGVAFTHPQLIRLAFILAATVLASFVSALRTRRELELAELAVIAEVAQQTVLRPLPERVGGAEVAVAYVSSATAARIGGDLYEVVETPWGVRILIGDVRGKGLEAVRLASLVLGSFRHLCQTESDLGSLAAGLDRAVHRAAGEEDFVTAVLAELDTRSGSLILLNCGHPNPILVRGGVAGPLQPPVPTVPLGLGAEPVPAMEVIEPDDVVLLYTDGLEEARSGGEWFDVTRAVESACGTDGLGPSLDRLQAAVTEFVGGHITDDIALVAFRPMANDRDPATVGRLVT